MNSYVDRHIFPVPRKNQRVALVVMVSAIDVLFSDCPKRLDLIFICLSGLMISIHRKSETPEAHLCCR